MAAFLGLLGITGFVVSLVMLIVSFIRKRSAIKTWLLTLGAFFVLTAVAVAITPPSAPSPAKPAVPAQSETAAAPPAEAATLPAAPQQEAPPASQQPETTVPKSEGLLQVHFIDVGQADSILVQLPGGGSVLIDGGNAADGEKVVDYLKKAGVRSLTAVVATHPHEDHIGGLDTVIRTFKVGAVYMPGATSTTRTFEDFLAATNASGAKRVQAKAGVALNLGSEVRAQFVAPVGSGYDDLNDWSAVLRLTYGKTVFLFAGDAEAISEGQMLNTNQPLQATVLKVGHHGSDSSTTPQFLKAVAPKYAVISVGKGNDYGHPTPETLARLASAGVQVYRTDEAGTIIATSDGEVVKLDKKASPIKPQAPPTVGKSSTSPSPAAPAPVVASPSANNGKVTVYVTNNGDKYHRDGCRSLAKSKIPISLADAKAAGYTPCKVCKPPQ